MPDPSIDLNVTITVEIPDLAAAMKDRGVSVAQELTTALWAAFPEDGDESQIRMKGVRLHV